MEAAARVAYHGRRWWVHVASAFPLARHFKAVLGTACVARHCLTWKNAVGYYALRMRDDAFRSYSERKEPQAIAEGHAGCRDRGGHHAPSGVRRLKVGVNAASAA